jgi:hypothetical protein
MLANRFCDVFVEQVKNFFFLFPACLAARVPPVLEHVDERPRGIRFTPPARSAHLSISAMPTSVLYIGLCIGGECLLYHGSATKLPTFAHHIKYSNNAHCFHSNHPSTCGILFSSNSAVKIHVTRAVESGRFVHVYLLQKPPRPMSHRIIFLIPSAGYLQAIKKTS